MKLKCRTRTPMIAYIPERMGREYIEFLGSQVEWLNDNPAKAPMTKSEILKTLVKTHKKNMERLSLIFVHLMEIKKGGK